MNVSKKSRLATSLLGIFLGWAGVDLFYVGKVRQGVFQVILFSGGIFTGAILCGSLCFTGPGVLLMIPLGFLIGVGISIWQYVRWIKALFGYATDVDGNIISKWKQTK